MACPKYTPPGYAPCTRDPDHDGPCAHPLEHPSIRVEVHPSRVVTIHLNFKRFSLKHRFKLAFFAIFGNLCHIGGKAE